VAEEKQREMPTAEELYNGRVTAQEVDQAQLAEEMVALAREAALVYASLHDDHLTIQ
jgi:hypothetical protein